MILWRLLYLVVWIWQGPQNIFGFLLSRGLKYKLTGPGGFKFYLVPKFWIPCMVLGQYIFLKDPRLTRYGYGRSVLSMCFGPLFLILVSIPGFFIMAIGSEFYFLTFYATKWSMKIGKK